jgi:hypothetical protein
LISQYLTELQQTISVLDFKSNETNNSIQSYSQFLCNLVTEYSSKIFTNSNSYSNSGSLLPFLYQQYQDNLKSSNILLKLIETYDLNSNKTLNQNSSIILISQLISQLLSTISKSISTIYSSLISKSTNHHKRKSFFNTIQDLLNFNTSIVNNFQQTIEEHKINIEIPNISDLTVDQIFKQFNFLFYDLVNDSEQSKLIIFQIFSVFDPTIELNGLQKTHEYFSLFSNKFDEFITLFQENYKHHFGCEIEYFKSYSLYQNSKKFFEYLKKYLKISFLI